MIRGLPTTYDAQKNEVNVIVNIEDGCTSPRRQPLPKWRGINQIPLLFL